MVTWNKENFILASKKACIPSISNFIVALVNFCDENADSISWGRGKGYGTLTFKCNSLDYGSISLFHLTTNGQIKFPLNNLRIKVDHKEIINDYQLKLESNFMMDFHEEKYPFDKFLNVDELFLMKSEINRFIVTIQSVSARLHQ